MSKETPKNAPEKREHGHDENRAQEGQRVLITQDIESIQQIFQIKRGLLKFYSQDELSDLELICGEDVEKWQIIYSHSPELKKAILMLRVVDEECMQMSAAEFNACFQFLMRDGSPSIPFYLQGKFPAISLFHMIQFWQGDETLRKMCENLYLENGPEFLQALSICIDYFQGDGKKFDEIVSMLKKLSAQNNGNLRIEVLINSMIDNKKFDNNDEFNFDEFCNIYGILFKGFEGEKSEMRLNLINTIQLSFEYDKFDSEDLRLLAERINNIDNDVAIWQAVNVANEMEIFKFSDFLIFLKDCESTGIVNAVEKYAEREFNKAINKMTATERPRNSEKPN